MQKIFSRASLSWVVVLWSVVLGIIAGWTSHAYWTVLSRSANSVDGAIRVSGYKFTSPLLICATSQKGSSQFDSFRSTLSASLQNIPNVSTTSVYFRDLNTGRWFGINENEQYDPASLLKVPVMIAWLKKAESDPTLFSKSFLFSGRATSSTNEFHFLKPGMSYTLKQLLESMIMKSDNDAKDVLITSIDKNSLNDVFNSLEINALPTSLAGDYQISAKAYSLFFRILYNSTYLSPEMSEKAFELLNRTTFAEGLRAGVPNPIAVAHKFGEYQLYDNPSGNLLVRELHDCGVVYHPTRPYVLCVMTKGTASFDALKQNIKTVSASVYEEVDKNYQ